LEDDVTSEEEIREFIHAFDLAPECWSGSFMHPCCTQSVINPAEVYEKVLVIVHLMRAMNLNYCKDMKQPEEQRRILEYTAYVVFNQVGIHKRDCELIHGRVFGVCSLGYRDKSDGL